MPDITSGNESHVQIAGQKCESQLQIADSIRRFNFTSEKCESLIFIHRGELQIVNRTCEWKITKEATSELGLIIPTLVGASVATSELGLIILNVLVYQRGDVRDVRIVIEICELQIESRNRDVRITDAKRNSKFAD